MAPYRREIGEKQNNMGDDKRSIGSDFDTNDQVVWSDFATTI
jgi:hypothetical protein